MPTLKNARHELFAQATASGKAAIEAHKAAGYKPDRGTACTLLHLPSISQRVAEILAARERVDAKATERAVERAAVDKAWIMGRLRENAELAMAERDRGVANRALELLGKEIGMFIDRRESGRPGEFASEMSEEELATIARRGGNGAAAADTGSSKPAKLH